MNRPRTIWLIFGACLAVMFAAAGWVSWTALRLERSRAQAEQAAAVEENVRLALWRMDSMLAPLVAQESSRPSYVYNAFNSAELNGNDKVLTNKTGVLVSPSPLLGQTSSNVLLHFQICINGKLTSPEVPSQSILYAMGSPATKGIVDTASRRLADMEEWLDREADVHPSIGSGKNRDLLLAAAPKATPADYVSYNANNELTVNNGINPINYANSYNVQKKSVQQTVAASEGQQAQAFNQATSNVRELQARTRVVGQNSFLNIDFNPDATDLPTGASKVTQGPFAPVWIANSLLLVRRVAEGKLEYIQGCWLDWPQVQRGLLECVKDIFPAARLLPFDPNRDTDPQGRVLVSLPIRFDAGPVASALPPISSPVLWVLAVVWACLLLATAAVAVLLHGVISLSERRAMFVSSVSHELRTPLTTFKMYSEMLAEGMVAEPSARQHYLRTLCSEANRLGHLVENVLAYSRLERGSARARVEEMSLGGLLGSIQPRLDERAARSGLRIVREGCAESLTARLRVDVTAVEQILFNLIDNSCKYAPQGEAGAPIHLETGEADGRYVVLRVKDHGPGLSQEAVRRLFQPFSKSAQQAAKEQPGVGLGLALCQRLSRSLGGSLRLIDTHGQGACFELRLPVMRPEAASQRANQ